MVTQELSDREFISTFWNNSVIETIDRQEAKPMSIKEFLSYCTACGGNWGGMLLSGIYELYPDVYNAIPDDMGIYAWICINKTIKLLGIS